MENIRIGKQDKWADILAMREQEYKDSRKESQIPVEKANEIVAKREQEYKAAKGGDPQMTFSNEKMA